MVALGSERSVTEMESDGVCIQHFFGGGWWQCFKSDYGGGCIVL